MIHDHLCSYVLYVMILRHIYIAPKGASLARDYHNVYLIIKFQKIEEKTTILSKNKEK